MNKGTCQYCFGEKSVFNGKDWIICPYCKGDGVCNNFEDNIYADRIFPDDRVPFDENQFYLDD